MNTKTILQVPMDTALRESATVAALEQGFSSLQEAVRVILNKLSRREMSVTIEPTVRLSPKAIKRYAKMDRDFEAGKNVYTYKSPEDMLASLGYVKDINTQKLRKSVKKAN